MKVGIDISQIVYEGTGTGTYFRNLVKWLPKVDPRNNYVFFGSSLRRQADLKPFTGKIFPFPPTFLDFFWNRLHILPVESLIGKIDVFHSSDWTQPPTNACKVAPILDMVVYKYPESLHPRIVETQMRRLRWVKKEADKIVTISESAKRDIVNILEIPSDKIEVIYLAAGEEFKPQSRSNINAVRKKYGLPEIYFLTMGSANTRKKIENVVAAAKKIGTPLVVIGKPGLGYIPPQDLPVLYAGARSFVYASLYEGFGIPILEAMACGTPVICGRNSSLPEAAGEAATYADVSSINDLADKMSAVKVTGKEMSQAKKFSWEKTARETVKVYEELAKE